MDDINTQIQNAQWIPNRERKEIHIEIYCGAAVELWTQQEIPKAVEEKKTIYKSGNLVPNCNDQSWKASLRC